MIEGLKPYAEYKESGSKWLGKVPSQWEAVPLGRPLVQRIEQNRPIKTKEILSLSLRQGVVPYSEKKSGGNKAKDDLTAYTLAYPGDIVVNSMNVVVGSVGLSKYFGAVSPVYYVLHTRNEKDSILFFDALFQDKTFQQSLWGLGNGILFLQSKTTGKFNTIRMRIPMHALRRVVIPQPPPDEQAAIVRFLDHANRKIDGFIRAKRKLIGLLNEQKQAIIHRAVTRGLHPDVPLKPSGIPWLGDIPQHWDTPLNRQVFRENIRPHKGKPERQLSLSQRDGLIATEDMQERSLQTSSFDNWKLTLPGDLVVNRFKAHLGVFFASSLRGIVSFHYGVFQPQRPLNTKYFELLYHTAPYRTIYAGRSNGMTVGLQNLSNQNFYAVRTIVPPVEEQNAIVEHLKTETQDLNTAIARTEREIALMQEYRTRLTADLVTGKLDVSEAAAKLPEPPTEPAAEEVLEEPEVETEEDDTHA